MIKNLKTPLVDTHAHLDSGQFRNDLDAVIERARENDVAQIITVGCDLESSRASIDLALRYPNLYASVGIHPHDASTVTDEAIDELRRMTESVEKIVAIGEIGDSICEAWGNEVPCRREGGLMEAVSAAFDSARPGQVVLFSPGTSSFDMFSSYVERGNAFRQCVNELKESHEKER